MFRTIQPCLWAFDCEWVPDAVAGRRLLGLGAGAPEPEVFEAMWQAAGATAAAPRPFLKTCLCRLASVALVERRVVRGGEVVLKLCALPAASDGENQRPGERELLKTFFDALGRRRPQLVGFNSHNADLRLLAQRGIAHGLSAGGFCKRPERPWEGPDYWYGQGEWNVDLMRVLGGRGASCPSLREMALVSGIPSKALGERGCSGGQVADLWLGGRYDDIRRYNEGDALTTYLLWLRTAHFAGLLSDEAWAREEGLLEALLERQAEVGHLHLASFLQRWRLCRTARQVHQDAALEATARLPATDDR